MQERLPSLNYLVGCWLYHLPALESAASAILVMVRYSCLAVHACNSAVAQNIDLAQVGGIVKMTRCEVNLTYGRKLSHHVHFGFTPENESAVTASSLGDAGGSVSLNATYGTLSLTM